MHSIDTATRTGAADMVIFTARLAPTFESQPKGERLYEVVTAEGERIASATNETRCADLAGELNIVVNRWAERVGFDAVLGG
jgi:hypothetical protein